MSPTSYQAAPPRNSSSGFGNVKQYIRYLLLLSSKLSCFVSSLCSPFSRLCGVVVRLNPVDYFLWNASRFAFDIHKGMDGIAFSKQFALVVSEYAISDSDAGAFDFLHQGFNAQEVVVAG
jgi:hypothetical protein